MILAALRTRTKVVAMRLRCSTIIAMAAALAASSCLKVAAATPNPLYYGGPVVSNANVVMVNWGATVPSGTQSGMQAFYADIVRSDYWSILGDYSTTFGGGTNQRIGGGTFYGMVTITPANTATTLTDTQVNLELLSQIGAGHIPAPTQDAAGNINTVLMVHFPPTISISFQGGLSCVTYCAYNSTITDGSLKIGVGVIPEQGNSGQCQRGCGGTTDLEAATLTSSDTLANVVTDPQVALASGIGAPLAWVDLNNGQIGDLCRTSSASATIDATSYAVRPLWSLKISSCASIGDVFENGFE